MDLLRLREFLPISKESPDTQGTKDITKEHLTTAGCSLTKRITQCPTTCTKPQFQQPKKPRTASKKTCSTSYVNTKHPNTAETPHSNLHRPNDHQNFPLRTNSIPPTSDSSQLPDIHPTSCPSPANYTHPRRHAIYIRLHASKSRPFLDLELDLDLGGLYGVRCGTYDMYAFLSLAGICDEEKL